MNKSFERLEYFWTYYKIQFIIVLAIIIFAGCFVYTKLTEKEVVFQALMFDMHSDQTEEIMENEFADYADIDQTQYSVLIDKNLLLADAMSNYAVSSQSKFYALIGTCDLDIGVMLENNFKNYAKADVFLDLREVFSEEELNSFPALYTKTDGKVIGVYINEAPKIIKAGGYSSDNAVAVLGIIYNTKHQKTARQFIEYLYSE